MAQENLNEKFNKYTRTLFPSQMEVEYLINEKCKNINCTLLKPFFYETYRSKLELQCNICKYDKWNPTYENFITRDYGCPRCNNSILLDKEEALRRLEIRCDTEKCILINNFNYIGAHETILKLKCLIDGNEWTVPYYRFVNTKSGCSKCSGVYTPTQEEAEKIVNDFCIKNNCNLIENFIFNGNKTKIYLRCPIDDYKWNPPFKSIKNDESKCAKCNGTYSPTQEEAEIDVNKRCIESDLILLKPFIFKSNRTKLELRCEKHDKNWSNSYENFVKFKQGCSKCGREKAKQTIIENHGDLFYYLAPRHNPDSIKYLELISKNLNIKILHALNNENGEKRFKRYVVDGYIEQYNICIEWQEKHHNWKKYKAKDLIKKQYLEDNFGCTVIYIWQKEFLKDVDNQLNIVVNKIKQIIFEIESNKNNVA